MANYLGTNGNDNIVGSDQDDNIYGFAGNDTIHGLGGDNNLLGGSGNDDLDGGDAQDNLYGEAGDDILNGGFGNDDLDGGSENDQLIGGQGDDNLFGQSGNDILAGGFGNDALIGGGGLDRFDFSDPTEGIDSIVDFSVADDTIRVYAFHPKFEDGFGGGLVEDAAITSAQFKIGSGATTASHRFIYNNSTGGLFFDIDGTGATAQVQFATLPTGLAMTHNDIAVIAYEW